MKSLIALAACLTFIACGSSAPAGNSAAGKIVPEVELVQLVGPEELNWERGEIEMKYALRVSNPSAEPITLRQIRLQTVGTEGPYMIPQSSYSFREVVAPGASRDIQFFAKARSEGNRYRIDAQSPVSVRTVAYFEAPSGNFRRSFIANLVQSFKNNN
jgi:hypothetical protein